MRRSLQFSRRGLLVLAGFSGSLPPERFAHSAPPLSFCPSLYLPFSLFQIAASFLTSLLTENEEVPLFDGTFSAALNDCFELRRSSFAKLVHCKLTLLFNVRNVIWSCHINIILCMYKYVAWPAVLLMFHSFLKFHHRELLHSDSLYFF